VSTAQLKREITLLRERRPSQRLAIAEDRVEFAQSLGIIPDFWQERLLRSDAPRVLLNCARQSGKSTMAAIIALHQALRYPPSLVLILAPAERQAKELFSKVAEAYRALGHIIPADSYRKMGMELANGSRIEALPGTEKTIRGFSGVDLLLVDEASRVADELYYAVRPMLAVSGGRLMMLTTPYGRRGIFFEEWTGDGAWERYEVPASQCPRISEEFLEEERRALPRRVYRQEYECSFEETDDQVFSHADVQAAISSEVTPLFGEAS
jgi:Terminase large subunit, T4likevirus-type, N-terminal